ncbi:MAG TPA: cupin domain-containing protein [Thermomicrobiales bacterium]|nr:cupin domain-containing protein [Thermomicrobiales bacterium]
METTARRVLEFMDNRVVVLVGGAETAGQYCLLHVTTPPGGGGNTLHTDAFNETFYILDGEHEFTVERDGALATWRPAPGEAVHIPHTARHKFTCVGARPGHMLAAAAPAFEAFFRALAAANPGGYDPATTPGRTGPVFARFGVRFFA